MSTGEMVLMQTAKGNVLNPTNGMQENVRMLFDSGSQSTYITEKLARKLKLKLEEKSKVALVTFGSEKPRMLDTPFTVFKHGAKGQQCFKINCSDTKYIWIDAETPIQYQLPTKLGISMEGQYTCRYFAK